MRQLMGQVPRAEAKKTRLPVDTEDDKGYWYALVGFLAATVASVLYITLRTYVDGTGFMRGPFILAWLFGLVGLGVFTYPAKFFDAAYIRGLQPVWQPKMWYWVLIGYGLPLGAFVASWPMFGTSVAMLLAIAVFIMVTFYMCASFLYRRHVYLGDP